MSRVLSRSLASRRTLVLLLALAAATLVTLGLFVDAGPRSDPASTGDLPSSQTQRPSGGEVDAASLADPAAVAPRPTDGAVQERDVAAVEETAAGGAGVAADLAAPDASTTPVDVLDAPSLDAKIIRTANIELDVRRGAFDEAWGDAQAIAAAHGGYIVSASRSGAGDSSRLGTITLRVPSGRFDAAVERVRGIDQAKVERLDVSSQDVTQEFVDTRSRLRHDRAVEGRLLALLAQTDGVSEVLAVQARLDQVQEQIEVSRGRIQYLEKLTSLSTITISLHGPASRSDAREDDESVLGEAWADARENFAGNVADAIVWVGGALPALLLLALLTLIGRGAWRRRQARLEA